MAEEKKDFMLSTIDNPFNPFTNFDEWYSFDLEKGYNTLSLLARNATTSNELTDLDNSIIIDNAINEIISLDPFGIRIKVTKDDVIKPISVLDVQEEMKSLTENKN